jgi:transposase
MTNFLTNAEILDLKTKHKSCDRKHADRIKAILMLDKGYSYEFIAEVLLMDGTTIRRWESTYHDSGVKGLLSDNYTGGLSYLTEKQFEWLLSHLEVNVYLTAKEICDLVLKKYSVEYTIKGMTNLLHNHGFHYKKPKQIPGKADIKAQQIFLEEYKQLKQEKEKEDKIYFVDGVHPMHNSQPAYGWIKKGVEMVIKSNTGRERININGAYNIDDHTAIIQESDTINAQSTVRLFEEILSKQRKGKIYIVLDNAKYYKNEITMRFVKKNPRIHLKFLPPYSPNLNLIERLWKFFKKKITYNTYYEKFSVFRKCCLNFFSNIQNYQISLKTLMTENFQLIQA